MRNKKEEQEKDAEKRGKEYAISIFELFSKKKNQGKFFTWEGVIESFHELCRASAELSYQGKQNLIDIAVRNAEVKFLLLVTEFQEKMENENNKK